MAVCLSISSTVWNDGKNFAKSKETLFPSPYFGDCSTNFRQFLFAQRTFSGRKCVDSCRIKKMCIRDSFYTDGFLPFFNRAAFSLFPRQRKNRGNFSASKKETKKKSPRYHSFCHCRQYDNRRLCIRCKTECFLCNGRKPFQPTLNSADCSGVILTNPAAALHQPGSSLSQPGISYSSPSVHLVKSNFFYFIHK